MEVLASRVRYRSGDFDALRRIYEHALGPHAYREYGPSEEVLGVVFFVIARFGRRGSPVIARPSGRAAQRPDALNLARRHDGLDRL